MAVIADNVARVRSLIVAAIAGGGLS